MIRAVEPIAIEAARKAEQMQQSQETERSRIVELELEQAQYDAQLAERRYAACDPDRRLIASQLEESWEEALQRVEACKGKLESHRKASVPTVDAEALEDLARDLDAAWRAPSTDMRTRQRLVRAIVEDIVADIDEDSGEIVLIVHWKGGQHTELRTRKPSSGEHRRTTSDEAVAVIRSMAGRWPDNHIAASLNRMGLRTGHDRSWNAARVSAYRQTHGISSYRRSDDDGDRLTMSEAASELGVSDHVIRQLIRDGLLPAQQLVEGAPYQIRIADLRSDGVRQALEQRKSPRRMSSDDQSSLFPDT
jgi:excisionase family DNA binding protein